MDYMVVVFVRVCSALVQTLFRLCTASLQRLFRHPSLILRSSFAHPSLKLRYLGLFSKPRTSTFYTVAHHRGLLLKYKKIRELIVPRISHFLLCTSYLVLPTSHSASDTASQSQLVGILLCFRSFLRTSYLVPRTSYFVPPTSYFLPHTWLGIQLHKSQLISIRCVSVRLRTNAFQDFLALIISKRVVEYAPLGLKMFENQNISF